jgi:C4-dicarboxylate transporter DctM subunit
MERHGYNRRLALGATAAAGPLGNLNPPSVAMILYGTLTETSIGRLFIAGILPGIMLASLLSLTILVRVMLNPRLAPPVPASTWPERWRSMATVWPVVILFTAVMGSIYTGIATPTESAAVGALGATAVAVALRRFTSHTYFHVLLRSVKTTAVFLLLLIGGLYASFVLTRLGIPQGLAAFLTGLDVEPWVIMVLINLILIVFGMFMDPLSILVITLPVFFPAVVALGYDPVWFGVIVTINTEIAAITPPVGFNLFVLKATIPGVDLKDVIIGSLQFIIPMSVAILILIAFPGIALYLPSLR